ncbi:non-ribosomal peptide synthetase [Sesbania bispinosa]|nr:non-ribosomal peptide synthetase [Sesbania bispinosa]
MRHGWRQLIAAGRKQIGIALAGTRADGNRNEQPGRARRKKEERQRTAIGQAADGL